MPRAPLRAVVHASSLVVALTAIAACALQTNGVSDVGPLAPGDIADGAASATNDAGSTNDASDDDAKSQNDVDGSSALDDASTVIDAAHDAPPADAGDPCDRDHDGHRAMDNTCFGDDCCDTDANVFPGQKSFFATQSACASFDYDCDGKASIEIGTVSCKLGFFTCSGDGFAQPAACGASATFTSCNWAAFSCSTQDDTRVQRCR